MNVDIPHLAAMLRERPHRTAAESNDQMRNRRQAERDKAADALEYLMGEIARINREHGEAIMRLDQQLTQVQLQKQSWEKRALEAEALLEKITDGQRVQHVKRGSTYRVLGRAKVQTDVPLKDYDEVVIYQSEHDQSLWVRLVLEFEDGRFVNLEPTSDDIPAPPSAAPGERVVQALTNLLAAVDAYAETPPQSSAEALASGDVATAAEEARAVLAALEHAEAGGVETHPDDLAVDRFAAAMKAKLAEARYKGRSGWDDPDRCSVTFLAELLVGHVGKGNPGNFEDIANLAMMLHQRGADPAVLAGVANTPETTPHYCYDDEWEYTLPWGDREALVEFADLTKPVPVYTLIKGPTKWAVNVPLDTDGDGEADDFEVHWFDSEDAALAALRGQAK